MTSPLPPPTRTTLANGLRVLVAPLPHIQSVTMGVFVKAGSRFEDERTNGLSHFLEHMLFRGTERYPSSYALNLAIEEAGGTLYGATHTDYTLYSTALPPENAEVGLAVLGDMMRAPIFAGIDVEKRILREELLEDLDEDGRDVDIDNLARELLFAPHPLGYKITGTIETVDGFTEGDLRTHLRRFYGARNLVLSIAGAIDPERAIAWAERYFGELPPGERPAVLAPDTRHATERTRIVLDQGSQTDVRLTYPSLGLADPRYTTLQLLGRILDDGLTTRVHRRIVDELGLAYDAFASLEPYEDSGVVDLGASVSHENAPRVLEALFAIVRELSAGDIAAAEVEKARKRYLWDLAAIADDDEATASFYGSALLFDLHETPESAAEAARSVTLHGIRDVASTVFAQGAARLACVGMLEEATESELEDVFRLAEG